jgi:hypothetical protein
VTSVACARVPKLTLIVVEYLLAREFLSRQFIVLSRLFPVMFLTFVGRASARG